MTDQSFEARLERVLKSDAHRAVGPIDAVELAEQSMSASPARAGSSLGYPRRLSWPIAAAIVATLLLVAMALVAVGAPRLLALLPPSAAPSSVPPTSAPPLAQEIAGTWLADKPDGLSFGDPSGPARMSFVVDSNGSNSHVSVSSSPEQRRLPASSEIVGPDAIRFLARAAASPGSGDDILRCKPGDVGTYNIRRSSDGLLLTLDPVTDSCAARMTVYARTWVRSLGAANSGGFGVVDSFDPLFTVDLPPGSFSATRAADAITVAQPLPEFQFLAFKDPQGFNDPCDPVGGGRRAIAPGADAIVDYFRQLAGFNVESVAESAVDGHRAIRLVVHANPAASCPSGRLSEWQPKTVTTDLNWFLRPGDTDSLVIVELADATLMFEVLPAPHELEAGVMDSIRFLDRLPSTP